MKQHRAPERVCNCGLPRAWHLGGKYCPRIVGEYREAGMTIGSETIGLVLDAIVTMRTAHSLMERGFIPPEDRSNEWRAGWEAACKEFGRCATREKLRYISDRLQEAFEHGT